MKFMEATYICHWIKRRVMGTTDIHLSDLYDIGIRKSYVVCFCVFGA